MLYINKFKITRINSINSSYISLSFQSPEIAAIAKPGQFVNIKVDETSSPLFRRPFSIHYVENDNIDIIFAVRGVGTKKLQTKKEGEYLDVIGPLGNGFCIDNNYKVFLLVAGGLGVATFPLLTKALEKEGKIIKTFIGARTKDLLVKNYLKNVEVATEDGSEGYYGNVVDLLNNFLSTVTQSKTKILGCGPNSMLKSLKNITDLYKIDCDVSIETYMACGFGICQGCSIKTTNNLQKYMLACINGPVFDINKIELL